jgi:succinoglycan biosynthesis protein ExoL
MIVTYFGSDLTDPATIRRIHVLRTAGVEVRVAGFRRSPIPILEVEGLPVVDLGQTFDRRLGRRCLKVLLRCLDMKMLRDLAKDSDVLLGRNLEMATMAFVARLWAGSRASVAYECLDIHRAFIGTGLTARLLRRWDSYILGRCKTLILSSPGYVPNYFETLDVALPNVVLAENKRVMSSIHMPRPDSYDGGRRPWRIGWFGKLRCTDSFKILLGLARRYPDLLQIELRGQPPETVQALIAQHLPIPNMKYGGPYTQNDLADIYELCDLAWGIEYFGRGSNSDWCLANRIYEGGYHNKPLIALAGTETAAWLRARGVGVVVGDPDVELGLFLADLTPEQYGLLYRACAAVPTSDLVWTTGECREFAARIAESPDQNRTPGRELVGALT